MATQVEKPDSSSSPSSSDLTSRLPPFVRTLLKLNEQVVGITLVAYLLGFVVTNLYLGSLGLVNFDVLRSKYILTGVLFLVFFSVIILPAMFVWRLTQASKAIVGRSKLILAARLLGYALIAYIMVSFIVVVLSLLSGAIVGYPTGLPVLSPPFPWDAWFVVGPSIALVFAGIFGGAALLVAFIYITRQEATNLSTAPGSNSLGGKVGAAGEVARRLRTVGLALIQAVRWPNLMRIMLYSVLAFLLTFIFFAAFHLLVSLSTNTVTMNLADLTPRFETASNGSARFLAVAFLCYLIVVAAILWDRFDPLPMKGQITLDSLFKAPAVPSSVGDPGDSGDSGHGVSQSHVDSRPGESNNPSAPPTATSVFAPVVEAHRRGAGRVWILGIPAVIVVLVYSLGVYPLIPQQIGGGSVMHVEAVFAGQPSEEGEVGPENGDSPEPPGSTEGAEQDENAAGSAGAESGGVVSVEEASASSPGAALWGPGIDLYLIDRTSSHTLFMVVDMRSYSHSVVQVANSEIKSMTYKPNRLLDETGENGEWLPIPALVTRVISGDTIEVSINWQLYTVRYLGVDAPDLTGELDYSAFDASRYAGANAVAGRQAGPGGTSECYAAEAMEANRSLVEGKTVLLGRDVTDSDMYGRLLRYVQVGDIFVSGELAAQGYARADFYPPDVQFAHLIVPREREARAAGRGMWGKECQPPSTTPAAPASTPVLGSVYTVDVTVSDPQPPQDSQVTVTAKLMNKGRAAPQAWVEMLWYGAEGTTSCNGLTDTQGVVACTQDIGTAPTDHAVYVDVVLTTTEGQVLISQTSFTPK